MSATSALRLTVLDHGTTRLLLLAGEVDIATVGRVRAALRTALREDVETLVLDLAAVTFMDSSGLHLARDATTGAARAGVRFVVLPGPPHVQRLFEVSGTALEVPFAQSGGRYAAGDGISGSGW